MDDISIKVTIANRVYPLKIKRVDEERVRRAAKMVNDRMKDYEEQYAGSDKFDFIAMCAFQFATELVNQTESLSVEQEAISSGIADLESRITDYLQSTNVH